MTSLFAKVKFSLTRLNLNLILTEVISGLCLKTEELIFLKKMLIVFYQKERKKRHLAKLANASVIGLSETKLDRSF